MAVLVSEFPPVFERIMLQYISSKVLCVNDHLWDLISGLYALISLYVIFYLFNLWHQGSRRHYCTNRHVCTKANLDEEW